MLSQIGENVAYDAVKKLISPTTTLEPENDILKKKLCTSRICTNVNEKTLVARD